MLEIRKSPNNRTSVHINGLDIRLPMNGSWLSLARFPLPVLEESANLKLAFENDLIEMRVTDNDYRNVPSWFLRSYEDSVKVPTEILEKGEEVVLKYLAKIKQDAHPIMLAILRTKLLQAEAAKQKREKVVAAILALTGEPTLPLLLNGEEE